MKTSRQLTNITSKEKQLILIVCFSLLVMLVSFVRSSNNNYPKIYLSYEYDDSLKQQIVEHIPVGSEVKRARSILESNGFGCSTKNPAKNSELYCKKEEGGWWSWGEGTRWYVSITGKKKVESVEAGIQPL